MRVTAERPTLFCMAARVWWWRTTKRRAGHCAPLLDDAGYVCDEGPTRARKSRRLRDSRFDLVVLDLGLPGMSGATSPAAPPGSAHAVLPIVFLTAHVGPAGEARRGSRPGAEDFITKPTTQMSSSRGRRGGPPLERNACGEIRSRASREIRRSQKRSKRAFRERGLRTPLRGQSTGSRSSTITTGSRAATA